MRSTAPLEHVGLQVEVGATLRPRSTSRVSGVPSSSVKA